MSSEQEKYNSLKNPAPALELVTAWALKRTAYFVPHGETTKAVESPRSYDEKNSVNSV